MFIFSSQCHLHRSIQRLYLDRERTGKGCLQQRCEQTTRCKQTWGDSLKEPPQRLTPGDTCETFKDRRTLWALWPLQCWCLSVTFSVKTNFVGFWFFSFLFFLEVCLQGLLGLYWFGYSKKRFSWIFVGLRQEKLDRLKQPKLSLVLFFFFFFFLDASFDSRLVCVNQ